MRFTAAVVSLLAGSAIAAPTDRSANQATDMSADASSIANMRLADMFSERQMAVLKVLSEHQQELGMSEEEKQMMDAFMTALHDNAPLNVKRQTPPVAVTAPTPTANNSTANSSTALGSLGGAVDGLTAVNPGNATAAVGTAASGVANTTTGAATGALSPADLLSILKSIPGLGSLLGTATGTVGGATSGLGSATSGLGGLTGGLSGLTGGLGGLTGGLGGLTGGLGGLTGGLGGLTGGLGGLTGGLGGLGGLTGGLGGLLGINRGGLLGGILIPGIL